MVNPFSIFFFENLTPEVTTAHFDLQVGILEAILYQWSTHTVMGTEIGANPHKEFILPILMSLAFPWTALLTFLTLLYSKFGGFSLACIDKNYSMSAPLT